MILLIDNYDSFVYNLARYVVEAGVEVRVVRNDEITVQDIKKLNPMGIILSPGPCSPNEAGICLETVKELHKDIPMLGVCLGHQAMGQYFGGVVKKAIKPVHGKTETIKHNGNGLFSGIESPTTVTRYHSLIVEFENHNDLEINSKTDAGEIMAFQHKSYPIYAVQFHPESVLSEDGRMMVNNFISIAKDFK
ncbi:MAG: anthranilate synthase component II [Alphaproteobacteria bacterium]